MSDNGRQFALAPRTSPIPAACPLLVVWLNGRTWAVLFLSGDLVDEAAEPELEFEDRGGRRLVCPSAIVEEKAGAAS